MKVKGKGVPKVFVNTCVYLFQADNDRIYVKFSDLSYDVLRYNILMQSGKERKESRKKLLLKMGATQPKNGYINYNELMRKKSEEKRALKDAFIDVIFAY